MDGLSVRHLTVRLDGCEIVRDVSFEWHSGLTMLLGRNGCGKTTLIRALLGLIPSEGEILLDGQNLCALSARERARALAYLPQRPSQPMGTTAIDYVALGGYALSSPLAPPGRTDRMRAAEELNRLGLNSLVHRPIDRLSGGELRLLGLARARMQRAGRLLLDEPLSGLDFVRQHEFLTQLRREKSPALMSLHDPMLAWQYADRILLMDCGALTADLPAGDEEAFISALNAVYGDNLRMDSVGDRRLPIWHDMKG